MKLFGYFAAALSIVIASPASAQQPPSERPPHALPLPVPAGARDLRIPTQNGDRLAATLYLPANEGRFPTLIVAPGANPASRNVSGWGQFAARLASEGIALLVWDLRGVGDTPGTWQEGAPLRQTADDLAAIARFLARHPNVRPDRIGVIGWSRGGWTGPMAAVASPEIGYVIAVSAPSVSPNDANIHQRGEELLEEGYSPEEVEEIRTLRHLVWNYYGTGQNYEQARGLWIAMRERPWFQRMGLRAEVQPPDAIRGDSFAYYREGAFDPAPVLASLNKPLLVLLGSADRHIPIDSSVDGWLAAFRASGNPDASLVVLARAGHGMRLIGDKEPMTAVTGHARLAELPEHPLYMPTLLDWLRRHLTATG